MKNKKLMIAVIAVVAVIALMMGVYAATRPQTQSGEKTFTVSVVHADEKVKEFTFSSGEEFLGPVLLAEGLIAGEIGPYGLEISTVDGEQAIYEIDSAYWALYEGEAYANQGIDTTPIVDGATYKLVYTLG